MVDLTKNKNFYFTFAIIIVDIGLSEKLIMQVINSHNAERIKFNYFVGIIPMEGFYFKR